VTLLSIVIVSFNARADLEECLRSLGTAPAVVSHEIIVVDNASSDGSADAARRFAGVRVMPLDRNTGFAAANNAGIRASRGDLLLLLNSDTIVPPGALDRLVAELTSTPEAAVAGPRLVDRSGRAELSFGRMMSPLNELRQKAIGTMYDRGWSAARTWVERATRRRGFVDWVSGACLLVRRADAEAVGLLDERFFMYAEDVDFCHSIRMRGRRVLFTPAVEITHTRGRSRAAAPTATIAAYRRSQLAFYEKHHPRWAPILRMYLKLTGATAAASVDPRSGNSAAAASVDPRSGNSAAREDKR
jgi:N-acetylglucosaminyl-diphospho-decaprenol L-rhamnosyltransferase